MSFKHTEAVRTFKALADDNRLEIMRLLIDGEKCGCVLLEALEIGQPTLSHHMRILCDAGLVHARKKGTWMHYSISAEGAIKIRDLVDYYVVFPRKDFSEKMNQNDFVGESYGQECCKIKQDD